jgi:Na+-driven multidrug efflux pump
VLFLNDFALFCLHGKGEKKLMDPKNKLGAMPVRPLLYTMAVPLMLSLLIQSLYNIVDSIFVARLSETALTAASLVYAIQFLMIAIGVGTAVGLNALLSRKLGQKKPEEACRAATTGLFLMPVNGLGQAAIPVVGYNYGSKQSDRVKQAWKVLLPTGIVFALCRTPCLRWPSRCAER